MKKHLITSFFIILSFTLAGILLCQFVFSVYFFNKRILEAQNKAFLIISKEIKKELDNISSLSFSVASNPEMIEALQDLE